MKIELIKDKKETKSPENRPPYIYQVPLGFIPGVGGKTIEKLLDNFETEMNILHRLSKDDIEAVAGEKVAKILLKRLELDRQKFNPVVEITEKFYSSKNSLLNTHYV